MNLILIIGQFQFVTYLSKILENLMTNRLNEYLNTHALLYNIIISNLDSNKDYLLKWRYQICRETINQNKFSLGLFFDISKAIDIVDHDLLISKLEYFGIKGVVYDYLKNRMNM